MIYEPKQYPIRFVMGVFGDRWSRMIIRDMMFRGSTRFQDFLEADEGIATNILSDRLTRLEAQQVISRERDPADGRQVLYQLTGKGRDLLPIMLAVISRAEKHDPETNVSHEFAENARADLFGVRGAKNIDGSKPTIGPSTGPNLPPPFAPVQLLLLNCRRCSIDGVFRLDTLHARLLVRSMLAGPSAGAAGKFRLPAIGGRVLRFQGPARHPVPT